MPENAAPFCIDAMTTLISADPASYRDKFQKTPAFIFDGVFAPSLLDTLMARAAAGTFVDDDVKNIGTREIEAPQRVGKAISLLLGQPALPNWLQLATGMEPLRAVMGRLVQTRANDRDALQWHDDMGDKKRQIAIVINLSSQAFDGGLFEMRHVGEQSPILSFHHHAPGTMMLFAVRPDLEHRVTPIISGGPRRVYTGWFLNESEHAEDPLFVR